jgi:hypothetical protein
MRKDKQKRLDRFATLISEIIKTGNPLTMKLFEGHLWAAMPQSAWCEQLKISDHTLRDLAKCCPPIVSTKTVNEDKKPIVLYRRGSTPHKSPRHIANIMGHLYRTKYGVARVSHHNWGCLIGLADLWPDGIEVDLFKLVLDNLKTFMVWVKATDPDCEHSSRYYEWLSISLLRKYHGVALEMYVAEIQASGKPPHPSLEALWPKSALG